MSVLELTPTQQKKLENTFREMKKRAEEDPVYFIDTFLYTFNPKQEPFHFRFKTFPFQKRLVRDLVDSIRNGNDLFVEKCREMGATYTTLAVLLWFWLFQPAANFLIGSRKEDYVDNRRGGETGNKEESLFGKIDYMMNKLPDFMMPEGYDYNKHFNFMSLVNPANGNVISGESSNENFSRGSRFRAILLDEFAFWQNDCFKKDTEVLTDTGWKLIKDCTTKDLVYSMDPETQQAKLMPVTKLHKVYAKELIEFKNKAVDVSCTPNHKILIKKKYNPSGARKFIKTHDIKTKGYQQSTKKMYFRRADEVFNQRHDFIPLVSEYVGGDSPKTIYGYKAEDFMEFLGWFISEGCSSNKPRNRGIGISQSKDFNPEKTQQIEDLLIRMGLPVRYYNTAFNIGVGFLPKEMFEELCSLGKAHDKYIPRKYLNLSKPLLIPLFDALIKGDGCRKKRVGRVDYLGYFTVSKELADNVQELAQKIGLKATIKLRKNKNPNWRDLYSVFFGFNQHSQIACLTKKIVKYNDFAYCVSTPYHTLYIRRNKIPSWSGNSSAWGSTADTTNCRIVLTTPGIKPSKAKRLRFGKDGEKIKIVTLSYNLDPRKDNRWLEAERQRRSVEDFNREIMINWEMSIAGRVYPEMDNATIGEFPFLLNTPLYCSWDFGLDGTAFILWQQNKANGKWRIIDSYENSNQPISFYLPFFGNPIDSKFQYSDDDLKAITAISQYPKAIHFGDPDVTKRSFVTLTTTRSELAKGGVHVQSIVPNDFPTRREITKIYLQKGLEISANPRTEFLYECLKMARYPQRREGSEATNQVVLPVHDFTSHYRTAMEYHFINVDVFEVMKEDAPAWADKTRNWLTNKLKVKGSNVFTDHH